MSIKSGPPIRRLLTQKSGSTITSVVIATAIGSLGILASFAAEYTAKNSVSRSLDKAYAESLAISLLDGFHAAGAGAISNLVSNSGTSTAKYPLCSYVNIQDRSKALRTCASGGEQEISFAPSSNQGTGNHCTAAPGSMDRSIILNSDPIAAMGDNRLSKSSNATKLPNRFFQIQVMDVSTRTLLTSLCGSKSYQFDPAARPNERFFVTVGVSYTRQDSVEEVVFSGVIWQ